MTEDSDARAALTRPGVNGTIADPTDIDRAKRMTAYRARQRVVARIALDRHIAHVYGPQYVRGWAA
jgi:hypothetical protein